MKIDLEKNYPGKTLIYDFLGPYNLTISALARAIDVPVNRISQICNNKREITSDTAIRLGLFFKTTPEFWMNLQVNYNLAVAIQSNKKRRIASIQEAIHYD